MKAFYRFFIFSLALLFLISCAKKEDVIKIGTDRPVYRRSDKDRTRHEKWC